MRLYGKIEAGFWQNPKVRPLSESAKILLLYLYSCPHGNSVGCFILPAGYIMADLSWPAECVSERVSELVSNGFIDRSESTGMTRIRGWWGHNTIENDNVAKAAVKTILSLPRDEILGLLVKDLNSLGNKFVNKYLNELPNEFPNRNLTEPNLTEPNRRVPEQVKEGSPEEEKFVDPGRVFDALKAIAAAKTDPGTNGNHHPDFNNPEVRKQAWVTKITNEIKRTYPDHRAEEILNAFAVGEPWAKAEFNKVDQMIKQRRLAAGGMKR